MIKWQRERWLQGVIHRQQMLPDHKQEDFCQSHESKWLALMLPRASPSLIKVLLLFQANFARLKPRGQNKWLNRSSGSVTPPLWSAEIPKFLQRQPTFQHLSASSASYRLHWLKVLLPKLLPAIKLQLPLIIIAQFIYWCDHIGALRGFFFFFLNKCRIN